MYQYLVSLVRQGVPIVVGLLAALLVKWGFDPSFMDSTTITVFVAGAFGEAYYAVFRKLELKYSDRWGWLLGIARPPVYAPKNSDGVYVVTNTPTRTEGDELR